MFESKICIIHSDSKIESFYTLFPLIVSKFSRQIRFLNVNSRESKIVEGDCVILVRTFKGNKLFADEDQKKRDYVMDFKRRFNRVIMLDDGAGSDSLHYEYMDLVDLYYKGKLLRDKSNYLMPMYGRQIFTNYYNEKFGIVDEKVKLRESPSDSCLLKKLRISWNLGYGLYPAPNKNLSRLVRAANNLSLSKTLKPWFVYSYKRMIKQTELPVNYDKKLNKVHARFGYKSFPNTIGHQRKVFMQLCANSKNVITGTIKPGTYNKEIKKIGAVLSPYGWGEVCFRDFEAVINGGLLIKPNMDHIETWPDIYQSSKTYVPIDWDGSNLLDTIDYVSSHINEYAHIIETAKDEYRKSLLKLDDKVLSFLEEASGQKIN